MTMADALAHRQITTLAQLDEVFEASSDRPMWLFKHSLACGISSGAWNRFQKFAGCLDPGSVAIVPIQDAREVSREISARTGVRHESPQVFLLKNGQPAWHESHWKITEDSLEDAAAAHMPPVEAAPSRE